MKFSNLAPLFLLLITPLISASPIEDISARNVSESEPSRVIKRDSDLFTKLKKKGTTYYEALEARRQEKCPVDVAKDDAKFAKYWTERIPNNAPPALLPQFGPRMINNGKPLPNNAFMDVEYRSKTNGVADKTAYDNLFVPQLDGTTAGGGGVIIAANNDRSKDTFADSDKLRFSEILFWEYKMAAESNERKAKVSKLNWVFRNKIVNTDTTALILEIHKRRDNSDKEQQWTMKDDADAFLALIGSDNVKSVVWLLNDHVNAFVRKGIPSIWTQPDGKSLAIEIGINK